MGLSADAKTTLSRSMFRDLVAIDVAGRHALNTRIPDRDRSACSGMDSPGTEP